MKKNTFMQNFREYMRSDPKKLATLDQKAINTYGYEMAALFEDYDRVVSALTSCTINVRINFRMHAVGSADWKKTRLSLTKQWRMMDMTRK